LSMVKFASFALRIMMLIFTWSSELYRWLESPGIVLSLVLTLISFWVLCRRMVEYAEIGPYPTVIDNRLFRILQRFLIGITRKDLGKNWYPLNSRLSQNPHRNSDNGHKTSGAVRDSARALIASAVDSIGCEAWEISRAKQSLARAGPHQHYAVGDLHLGIDGKPPDENNVIVGVDIDYYLKDPGEFLSFGLPMIFHTFNPTEVSGKDGDSRFRIVNNEVIYDVSGGGRWKHRVWDWCNYGEFIEAEVVRGYWHILRWLGISKVVYQKIHYSRPWEECPHRVLVWLIPAYSCIRFNWIKIDLAARTLKRVTYSDEFRKGWNAIINQVKDKLFISCGRQGEDASFRIEKENYDILMGLSSAQSVTTRMLGLGYKEAGLMALVGQYFAGKEAPKSDPDRLGNPIKAKVHWPLACDADEPETTSRVYATPIVTDANVMPMIKRWEVLSQSLERRVTSVANNKTPSPKIQAFASEFVRLVTPEVGKGCPYALETTAEKLNKPSQTLAVKSIWETVDMAYRKLIEAFVKNEPCMKSGRIISSFADMRYMLKFSSFSLSFRDKILHAEHNDHWFCPGRTPKEIATKVCDYVKSIFNPMEGDYSNLDGSVSAWIQRHVVNACYLRYFNPKFKDELQGYLDMLISCPARAKRFGFRYEPGVGVKSGGPLTCDGNTLINAFVMYCSVRMTQPDLTSEEAFRLIGLSFGDDSLFDELYKKSILKVVDDLGLTMKIEKFKPEQGLTFLARVYPDPYTTETTFQDPLRTWRKLHITSRDPNIPLASAAIDRLEGYLVTDGLTPVTSNYARMVVNYYEGLVDTETSEMRKKRKSADREKPFWLTEGGSWPQDEKDKDLMIRVIAARTGLMEEELRSLCLKLDDCKNPWADFTINRDEEPSPYKDTLDMDALPCDGSVDDRIYQNDRKVTQTRAIESYTSNGGVRVRANPSNTASGNRDQQGSFRKERSERVSRIPRRCGRQVSPGDQQYAGKTKSGGGSDDVSRARSERNRRPVEARRGNAGHVGHGKSSSRVSQVRESGPKNHQSISGPRNGGGAHLRGAEVRTGSSRRISADESCASQSKNTREVVSVRTDGIRERRVSDSQAVGGKRRDSNNKSPS